MITGVAMVASGIPPLAAMLTSLLVFAGASMVASAQLLASGTPAQLKAQVGQQRIALDVQVERGTALGAGVPLAESGQRRSSP